MRLDDDGDLSYRRRPACCLIHRRIKLIAEYEGSDPARQLGVGGCGGRG